MRQLISRLFALQIVVGLGIVCLLGAQVSAATPKPTGFDPSATSGLEISPALIELNGERGKSYLLKLKVHNVTKSDLTYSPSINDFAAKDETGSPKFLTVGDLPASASMIGWVKTAPAFTLKKDEMRQIDIVVTIPANAEPGGHYGVVNFAGKDPLTVSTSVGVKVSTGLLMLIRVAGTVDEKLSVASLTAEQNGKQHSFFEQAPINFVSRIKNQGNVHVKPVGSIEARDMFGRITSTLKVNEKTANVLPNSIRRFESTLNKDWMIGRYTATLTLGYGTTGQVLTSQVAFWVIPYKLLLAILVVLVTLGYIARQMLKVYNRRVIEKYKKKNDNQTKTPSKK